MSVLLSVVYPPPFTFALSLSSFDSEPQTSSRCTHKSTNKTRIITYRHCMTF
ncbi:hypothetical protein, unlikely [Trypanosoma brucei brucei TREU927]|uniref:Uncharacterized protein n=1 Tax=Trypanosoma brucei brucei (strain 927/4 GUTat10.1) TaxID=185431 RepID=Q38FV4_TRYB2|nr:hypothetical protein, unlikely [Trypanosoma brucei brucei TREU927]EAN76316.1 hypothetical protein, unlikely [Trypanosoma brucei brucei TREU927]